MTRAVSTFIHPTSGRVMAVMDCPGCGFSFALVCRKNGRVELATHFVFNPKTKKRSHCNSGPSVHAQAIREIARDPVIAEMIPGYVASSQDMAHKTWRDSHLSAAVAVIAERIALRKHSKIADIEFAAALPDGRLRGLIDGSSAQLELPELVSLARALGVQSHALLRGANRLLRAAVQKRGLVSNKSERMTSALLRECLKGQSRAA